jgi:hypothetical protein
MEKEFIPYEQALALKELGFDEECFYLYDSKIFKSQIISSKNSDFKYVDVVQAPLYQQAFRWFREKYNLFYPIIQDDIMQYYFSVPNSERLLDTTDYCYDTYEEAEIECLKKLIELCKNN